MLCKTKQNNKNFLPLEADAFKPIPCQVNFLLNISSPAACNKGLRRGTVVGNRKFAMMWEVYWKFCAKKIIQWSTLLAKVHWADKKMSNKLCTWRDTVFNPEKCPLCVHSWVSSSFWWYSWHTLEMICVFCFPLFFTLLGCSQSGKEI